MHLNNPIGGTSCLCIFQLGWPGVSLQTRTNHGQGRHTKALSSAQVQPPCNMSAVLFLQGRIRKPNGPASAPQGHSFTADPEQTHRALVPLLSHQLRCKAPDLQSSIYPRRGSTRHLTCSDKDSHVLNSEEPNKSESRHLTRKSRLRCVINTLGGWAAQSGLGLKPSQESGSLAIRLINTAGT